MYRWKYSYKIHAATGQINFAGFLQLYKGNPVENQVLYKYKLCISSFIFLRSFSIMWKW